MHKSMTYYNKYIYSLSASESILNNVSWFFFLILVPIEFVFRFLVVLNFILKQLSLHGDIDRQY